MNIQLRQTTAQDLLLDLGPPLRVHHKEDDRMKIHAGAEEENEPGCRAFPIFNRFGANLLPP